MTLHDLYFSIKTYLRTGHHVVIANGGKPIDEIVIRHGEYFFCVELDAETGEPTGEFMWSRDPGMFHVPFREHYYARRDI